MTKLPADAKVERPTEAEIAALARLGGYTKVFNAIAAAVRIEGFEGRAISISPRKFVAALALEQSDAEQGEAQGMGVPFGAGHSRAEPEEVSALRASVPNAADIQRVTAYLAQVAADVAWQAGVGGMETAGSFVSYLAANPEKIPEFIGGHPSDLPPRWHVEGCLSWHGMDGKIHRPNDIRRKDGRREH